MCGRMKRSGRQGEQGTIGPKRLSESLDEAKERAFFHFQPNSSKQLKSTHG